MACVGGAAQFVDGSPLAAWKASLEDNAPFTNVVIADQDAELRAACADRLRRYGAPVVELEGTAIDAARHLSEHLSPYGLHVAFLDPFSLGALSIELIRSLAKMHHVDILAHVSAMDLFRNFRAELNGKRSEFDDFAPGWRTRIPTNTTDDEGRRIAINYWKELVQATGMNANADLRQIRNSVNRDIYWLMLIASADLASRFWRVVLTYDTPQIGLGI